MQASSPDGPVVAAGEGFSDHAEFFSLQKLIVCGKACKKGIFRPHRPVKNAKALPKTLDRKSVV